MNERELTQHTIILDDSRSGTRDILKYGPDSVRLILEPNTRFEPIHITKKKKMQNVRVMGK